MIKVTIGDLQREFASRSSIDESWINQQIEVRRRDTGRDPCVRVYVNVARRRPDPRIVHLPRVAGRRPCPHATESSMVAVWQELDLGGQALSGGRLVAFLKRAFSIAG